MKKHPYEDLPISDLMSGMLDNLIGLQINNYVPDSHKIKDYTAEKLLFELQNLWVCMQFRLAEMAEMAEIIEKVSGEKEKDSGQ